MKPSSRDRLLKWFGLARAEPGVRYPTDVGFGPTWFRVIIAAGILWVAGGFAVDAFETVGWWPTGWRFALALLLAIGAGAWAVSAIRSRRAEPEE